MGGRRIVDLSYDPGYGHVVIRLDGLTLYVTADRDGCHVVCDEVAAGEG